MQNAEKKAAGLHPKHIPDNPCFSVRTLPRVIRDGDASPAEGTGDKHRFLGRAGHIRFYEAERYIKMRGQWQWLPPIPPPDGIEITYKIVSRNGPATEETVL